MQFEEFKKVAEAEAHEIYGASLNWPDGMTFRMHQWLQGAEWAFKILNPEMPTVAKKPERSDAV